jgi:hypothetical protein
LPPGKKSQQENTNVILCFFFDRMGADEKRMESSRYWLPYSISNYTNGALIYCGLPDHSMCARLRTKSRANGAVVLRHASQRAGVRGEARAERPGLFRRFRSVQGTCPCERWRALPPTAAAAVYRETEFVKNNVEFFIQINANAKQSVPKVVDIWFSVCYYASVKQLVPIMIGGHHATEK